jgi:hypothetical protein
MIVSDYGTELTSMAMLRCVTGAANGVALHRTRQAAAECLQESFNGRLRDELNMGAKSSLSKPKQEQRAPRRHRDGLFSVDRKRDWS